MNLLLIYLDQVSQPCHVLGDFSKLHVLVKIRTMISKPSNSSVA
jgi:hypothetical protein